VEKSIFTRTDRGFVFERSEDLRYPLKIAVRLEERGWVVAMSDGFVEGGELPLFNVPGAISRIVREIWPVWIVDQKRGWCREKREWLKTALRKAIARRVRDNMMEVLDETFSAEHLQIQRKIYGTTLHTALPMVVDNYLLPDADLCADIERFPGARLLPVLFEGRGCNFSGWRDELAYGGSAYRASNITLDRYPGGVPLSLARNLHRKKLPHPITHRAALTLYLQCNRVAWADIFARASNDQVKRAMQAYNHFTHRGGSWRKAADLDRLQMFIRDSLRGNPMVMYRPGITVVGLTDYAVTYHQDRAWERMALQANRPTALPPIPLPDAEGITFLDCTDAVREEGIKMRHCVPGYADAAVAGDSYLFHIEYKGEKATAEVFGDQVRQIYGPANGSNKACRYGRRVLGEWVKDLTQDLS